MQELEFAELDEGGRLVVVAEDGTRYAVPVDDRLRAAMRPRRQTDGGDGSATASATPREVQAMIRAGQTAEDVASATGWELARVRRFEGPVLAEREHVVGLAKAAHVRAQGRTDGSHTLERRVRERLQSRGVPPAETRWDAARTGAQGPWTVVVSFPAGGRERQAAWHYEVQDRSIEALDDEARWLSEDEQALPGGLAGHPLLGTSHAEDETADLMATMRERRQARGRRRRPESARAEERARDSAGIDNEPLPLEDLDYDPRTMGDPPAAHPRGSAPDSPAPVSLVREAAQDGPAETAEAPPESETPRVRRERRRLRIPKLPPVLGEPEDDSDDVSPELSYARTHDPQEVSFDEFFGTDEEQAEGGEDDLVLDPAEDDELASSEGESSEVEDTDDGSGTFAGADHGGDIDTDDKESDDARAGARDGSAPAGDADADDLEALTDGDVRSLRDVRDEDTGDAPRDEDTGDAPDAETVDRTEDAVDQPEDESLGAGRRKGRTSVPSWDDIMFGGGKARRG